MIVTRAQQEVLTALKQGLYVWTNEGKNLKAWLGDTKGNKCRSIRVRTVEVLVNAGYIKCVDGDYRQGIYKYILNK